MSNDYYGDYYGDYYAAEQPVEEEQPMEEEGEMMSEEDWGKLSVVANGVHAGLTVVSTLGMWYVVYAKTNSAQMGKKEWDLTFYWDKAWNSRLLINSAAYGPWFLIWGGMALFNSSVFAAAALMWSFVIVLAQLANIIPTLFIILSIACGEGAVWLDWIWMIEHILVWLLQLGMTVFFGLPMTNYIAEQLDMENPWNMIVDAIAGDAEDADEAEEDDMAEEDNAAEEDTGDDWA